MHDFVIIRMTIAKVDEVTQSTSVARYHDRRFSGFVKLGSTPGGGAREGPFKRS